MATITGSRAPGIRRAFLKPLSSIATAGLLAFTCLAVTLRVPAPTPLAIVAAVVLVATATWMLLSERYEWCLAVLMLYLGLADGYLKLKTDSNYATLLRDVLLYAIAVGALVRIAVRGEAIRWPPLSGWILAWTAVVLIQVFNPHNGSMLHSFASTRPLIEFVPLFFLGYAVMQSKTRIRRFLVLLLAIATVNGIVGLVQLNLSPEQLSSWGPGYRKAINGEGSVSARTFVDKKGREHTRPFALGGDFGFGGIVGLIAVPAAIALVALERRSKLRILALLLAAGAVTAVVSSEARTAVLGSVMAVIAFAGLTVSSRAGLRTVVALTVGLLLAYFTIGFIASDANKGSFDRYSNISNPGQAITTTLNYRSKTLALIPTYAREFPLGAGIGSNGPAASLAGASTSHGHLDAESEPTYLLIEVGIPGMLVMFAFNLMLFYLSVTRIRKIADRETRLLLTAVAAPLFALFSTWIVGVGTATVPSAPYLWFAAGILAYWLLGEGRNGGRERVVVASRAETPALPVG